MVLITDNWPLTNAAHYAGVIGLGDVSRDKLFDEVVAAFEEGARRRGTRLRSAIR